MMRIILSFVVVFILSQVWKGGCEENDHCQPGFSSDVYVFFVNGEKLSKGGTLGKVHFDDCIGSLQAAYTADNPHIDVMTDGTVIVNDHMTLHNGLMSFAIHTWDSKGKKFSTEITVQTEGEVGRGHFSLSEHHHHHHDGNHHEDEELQVLMFPRSRLRNKRQNSNMFIPPVYVRENERKLPMQLTQLKSTVAEEMSLIYKMTGEGADQDPKGVFVIDKDTGMLSVTQPLDRETKARYTLQVYAIASQTGLQVDRPLEVIIRVIDMNDNSPVFTKQIFQGCVPEGVPAGTSVMTVSATDADEPKTFNTKLGYSIVSQDPKIPSAEMFTVDRNTGVISTLAAGFNRETVERYTLILQVADMDGNDLSSTATAIISVTDGNDNEPQIDPNTGFHPSVLTAYAENKDSGTPASNLSISVYKSPDQCHSKIWRLIGKGVTSSTGHNSGLLAPSKFEKGTYKVIFETGKYWERQGQTTFYPFIEIVFSVTEPAQKIHIPLFFNATSYSTYKATEPETKLQQ